MIHRIATSRRYNDSLDTIQTKWSLDDVMDATEVLDMYDVLEERANADPNDEVIT